MGSIKATFSAVSEYASNCSDDYVLMINTANEILSRVENIYKDVQEDYEKIGKQIVRLQMMRDEVSSKTTSYEYKMNSAAAEVERWQAEIDYLYSHPDVRTTTDEDGNETTELVYDYAAINAAERNKAIAREEYYHYRGKFDEANSVLHETERAISRFETIKSAIHAVGEAVQNDIYEIKKYINAIGDEAEYNSHSLAGVIGSLSTYLASKAMFMPAGAHYEDFASPGGGGFGSNSPSTSKSLDEEVSLKTDSVGNSHNSIELNEVSLSLDDLTESSTNIEDLPDKTEFVQYQELSSAKDYSHRKYVRQSQKALQSLDWESQNAFRSYSNEGYLQINNYLRGKDPKFISTSQKEFVDKNINSMTKAINNQTLPHNMKLYRGISSPNIIFGDGWESKSLQELRSEYVGKIFTEKGFCSTTISRGAAEDFTRTREGTMIEITAPKGANGIFMEQVSVFKQEKEVLLQRGSGFKITGIDYNSNIGYVIKTQLIGRR